MTMRDAPMGYNGSEHLLKLKEIQKTLHTLYQRISERFPGSSLSAVCHSMYQISLETDSKLEWIRKPNLIFRIFSYSLIAAIILATIYSIFAFEFTNNRLDIASLVQIFGSGLEGLAIAIAGMIFFTTIEKRGKRTRIISAINRLRCFAHIIDMHQLTKDPDALIKSNQTTATSHSPDRELDEYQLGRYLDYCSEMLSLTSKLGFLYIQHFPDPIATNAVNDLETLITGLSNKIWQKIMLLDTKGTS